MSDTKITSLTATTSLDSTDVIPVVTDVGSSPTNKKITRADLSAAILETASPAGKGVVLTTPDGLHTYRVAVDNDGVLTTEQLS